jgi:hypothetical protein
MSKLVYSLKQKRDTDELHLFEGVMTSDTKCQPNNLSICQAMHKKDSEQNIFWCEDESSARSRCAAIGRRVCGTCVSHLYTTY